MSQKILNFVHSPCNYNNEKHELLWLRISPQKKKGEVLLFAIARKKFTVQFQNCSVMWYEKSKEQFDLFSHQRQQ